MSIDALRGRLGQEIGVSPWVVVDQHMIDLFARATHDWQSVHNEPMSAMNGPFGGTIAHGFLTLSLLTHLITASDADPARGVRTVLNYGTDKVRFLAPLRSGSKIRGRFRLVDLTERSPGEFRQTVEASVEVEGSEKPALVALWLFQRLT